MPNNTDNLWTDKPMTAPSVDAHMLMSLPVWLIVSISALFSLVAVMKF